MKTCPYCAEQIQDAAVRCPHCRSDLTVGAAGPAATAPVAPPPPAGQPPPAVPPPPAAEAAAPGEGALRFTHSGERYVLGYGVDFFGVWDRAAAGGPVVRFPRTDAGWDEAWHRFAAWEPHAIEVPLGAMPAPDLRTSVSTFRSGRTLAGWTIGLLAGVGGLTILVLPFRAAELAAIHHYTAGAATLAQVNARAHAANGISDFASLIDLALMVVWLVWQFRAQSNLPALGARGTKYSPGWAVGWWFIPVANFAMPYLTMRELWKASRPDAGAVDWRAGRAPALLALWWAAWLGRIVAEVIAIAVPSEVLGSSTYPPSVLGHVVLWNLVGDVVTLLAAALAIALVLGIDRGQRARFDRARALAPGAWGVAGA